MENYEILTVDDFDILKNGGGYKVTTIKTYETLKKLNVGQYFIVPKNDLCYLSIRKLANKLENKKFKISTFKNQNSNENNLDEKSTKIIRIK